ncbi:MAG: TonB-dependent receptor, partial [bacterium]
SGIPNFNTNKSEETFSATGKFLAEPTDNTRASLMAGITQDFGLVDFGGIVGGDERRSVVDAKISHDFGKFGKLDYQSYWERHYMSSKNLPALGTVIVDNVDAILQYSFAFDISADVRNTMTYGAEYRFANLIDRSVRSINNYAGFLQDEFRFFDWVILTGGMRADYQQNFAGLNISANGSTVFLIHPRYTLRLGFGSAFNTPNYIHYYAGILQPLLAASTGTIVGNRNLHAERVLYLDVGNTIVPIDGVTVRADFFYYRLNDLIVPQLAFAATGPVASFINDGGAAGVGGEIGITGEVSSWLEGYANWSYEHFTPINNNFNSTPNLGNPRNKAGAGLRGYWFGRRLTANIDFNYTQSHQFQAGVINFPITPLANVNSFYLLNARVAYWPIRDHLEIAVAANNILNNNSYQVPPFDSRFNLVLAERPRFNIWGSVRYQF